LFNNGTAMPMSAIMCACAILSFSFLMIGRKAIRNSSAEYDLTLEN